MTPHRLSFVPLLIAFAAPFGLAGCGSDSPAPAAGAGAPQAAATRSPGGLELRPLRIESDGKRHDFTVEMARSPQEQARGLMFRTELAPDAGMLFPFEPAKTASFWMKNTPIPLDIVFIRADGTIESIAAETEPYSLAPVQSGEPVAAVLEIAGGRAAALGIEPGDTVRWQAP